MVIKGEKGGRDNQVFRISKYKPLYIKQINHKVLLCSTGNYIQYLVINYNGKEFFKTVCESHSVMSDSVTPTTIQAMEFSRPEYWSGYPFPPPGDLFNPGIEPRSPALQVDSLPVEPQRKPLQKNIYMYIYYTWITESLCYTPETDAATKTPTRCKKLTEC